MSAVFTDENFDQEVVQSDVPVIVDFWATWCGPCQMMAPIIDTMAQKYDGKVKIGKYNIEEGDLAEKYGIMSIPTLKVFKGGEVVADKVGGMGAEDLEKFIQEQLS